MQKKDAWSVLLTATDEKKKNKEKKILLVRERRVLSPSSTYNLNCGRNYGLITTITSTVKMAITGFTKRVLLLH